jgi:hypothetical protein
MANRGFAQADFDGCERRNFRNKSTGTAKMETRPEDSTAPNSGRKTQVHPVLFHYHDCRGRIDRLVSA